VRFGEHEYAKRNELSSARKDKRSTNECKRGAPYKDRVQDNGRTLIYEGHDNPVPSNGRKPKEVDQESRTPDGKPTQNGLFYESAQRYKTKGSPYSLGGTSLDAKNIQLLCVRHNLQKRDRIE
jgi:hypothetical protein